MKTQTIVILWVSVALGFGCLICLASYLTSQLIAQKNRKVLLVVAKHDYLKGTAITDPEEMFEIQEIFDADAPPGIVTDLKELRGMSLTSDIREGQPVQHGFLERTNDSRNNVKLDPPGPGRKYVPFMAKGREGSIRVGTRVDVIQNKSKNQPKAETILLHNVLVRVVNPASKDNRPAQEMLEREGTTDLLAFLVIVEASDAEADQFLAVLKESKNTYFGVRPSGDIKKVDHEAKPNPSFCCYLDSHGQMRTRLSL